MVVSWRVAFPPDRVEVLALGPPSALSRMALEMEAVSPLLRASTMRNLRTDCSREAPLPSIEFRGGEAWVWVWVWVWVWFEWVRARFTVAVDGFELWRFAVAVGGAAGGCAMLGSAFEASVGSAAEEVPAGGLELVSSGSL